MGAQIGQQFLECGDVSGDGQNDILITSTSIRNNTGGVLIIPSEDFENLEGSRRAFDNRAGWIGAARADATGASVWCDGDLTGDEIADILIGAPYNDACSSDSSIKSCGVVYLLEGGPDMPPSGQLPFADTPLYRGPEHHSFCGKSVTAGHFDDDEILDIAVGCPGMNQGEGRVLFYQGDPDNYHNNPFPNVAHILESGRSTQMDGEHFANHLKVVTENQSSNLWIGTPATEGLGSKFQSGSLELWTNLLQDTQASSSPTFSIEGEESFHRVGSAFWGSDLLFVRTQTE